MKPTHVFYAFRPELRETDLPAGVIGQVAGIALVYDVVDGHGSTFSRGALDRTIRERVAAGKVKLFWDHGDSAKEGFYDSDLHIGTVQSIVDVQMEDGHWGAYMVANLVDTPKAHMVKLYLQGVLSSGGETGLSIGCMGALTKGIKSSIVRVNGEPVERITEFPLSEISITSMQSVPDSEVLAVRAEGEAADEPVGTIGGPEGLVQSVQIEADIHAPEPAPQPIVKPITVPPVTTPPPRPLTAVEPVPVRAERHTLEAALDTLLLSLPTATVRARLRAVMGDAWMVKDSDAPHPDSAQQPRDDGTGDSHADAQDSRTTPGTETLVVYATMEERRRALSQSYAEAP